MDTPFSRLTWRNLRSIFYLITPQESSFDTVDQVPNYVDNATSWFMVLIVAEMVILCLKQKGDAFSLNDTITSVNAGILSILLKVGGRAVSLSLYIYVYDRIHIVNMPTDSAWTWIAAFFIQDFAYYLAHRAIHEAGVFWSFHQMHHNSEYYNLSTALRQACLSEYGTLPFDLLHTPVIPPSAFLVHRYLNVLYQFWVHTELVTSLGPLEYVLNTPSHHRVHHGRNPYCIDKNYAGTLIIWDRMFGTFEAERPEDKPIYGLVDNAHTFDQLYLQFFEYKALGWDKGRLLDSEGNALFPGIINKLKAALWPPGYFPGSQTKQFFLWRVMVNPTEGVPEVDPRETKYNPEMSTALRVYTTLQFCLLLSTFLMFIAERPTLSYLRTLVTVLLMIAHMQSLGYFFDRKKWARQFEAIRILFTSLYAVSLGRTVFATMHTLSLLSVLFIKVGKYAQQ